MKRIYLVVLCTLLFNSAHAQLFTIAGQDIGFVYFGPKIGANFSKISNMDQTGLDVSNRLGYQFGGVAEFGLTNMLSFETELVFTSKGMSNDLSATRVNYLSIPLLAKVSFNMLGLSRVYAIGGTYNNIRTNARVVYEFGESFSETEHFTVIDWGLSVGAGAAYDIGYGLLCLDLRYDLGIVDVEKVNVTEKNRNRSFGIALTFKYDAVDLFLRLRKQKLEPDA